MPSVQRKKGFSVKFGLSLPGLLGVGVVCFCIFLWMFLLGIWSGQTFLSAGKGHLAGPAASQVKTLPTVVEKVAQPEETAVLAPVSVKVASPITGEEKTTAAVGKKAVSVKNVALPETEADPAFFTVQVGAFKDGALAAKEVKAWQDKGYKAFSRPPGGAGDLFTRVYIGHFESMAAAKENAAVVSRKGEIKPFIVLIPAD